MEKLFKCSVCGFVHEGDEPPEKCPKCDAPKEKFDLLSTEDAQKIYNSDRTNDIHMEIVELSSRIARLCEEGIELKLDPACVELFKRAKDEIWVIKQRSKAEMETHMKRGKW